MPHVDLNCDLGEGFGHWALGDDEAMLGVVTSANVACGFHAGDPLIMRRTAAVALAKGVRIGAHPGFSDLRGFGRRPIGGYALDELEADVAYQIGAMQALAIAAGHRVTHVKAHGALSNLAMGDEGIAGAIARATRAVDASLILVVQPLTEAERAGEREGLPLAREVFADRAYEDDATLTPRSLPGSVIHDPAEAAARVVRMVGEGAVTSRSGKRIPMPIDTICVHGDTPGSVAIARAVRGALEAAGVEVRAFGVG